MPLNLLSHVRADGDLLQAWLDHYVRIGVTAFHLIVHGPRSDNATLYRLADTYPVLIRDQYDTEFADDEKARRINLVLASLPSGWTFCVDSDEFVELPYRDAERTVRILDRLGVTALYAPFLHRVAEGGSLDTPEVIPDPFRALPLCSSGLHSAMGVYAAETKYPLFRKQPGTVLDGGHHRPPNPQTIVLEAPRGVTHHFKWRRSVLQRLASRANSAHSFRHESAGFLAYLAEHGHRVPTEDAFMYSRDELFRRRLLRRAGATDYARVAWSHLNPILPGMVRRHVGRMGRLIVQRIVKRRDS